MKKTEVKFSPETQRVENGSISCVTTLIIPETTEKTGSIIQISAFQCDCGCSPSINISQLITEKENQWQYEASQITIEPEELSELIKALNTAYEKIISKKN